VIVDSFNRLTLQYTRKCSISCDHCITESSPNRLGKIPFEMAHQAVADAIRLKFTQIGFTGGEALLYKAEVLELARMGRDGGCPTILVMSNGFWMRSRRIAKKMADDLAEAGVTHVCISSDHFHVAQGFSFESAVDAVKILHGKGIKAKIQYARQVVEPELESRLQLAAEAKVVVDVFPVYPFGRALGLDRASLLADAVAIDERCTFGPLVTPEGQVIKCCGGRWVTENADAANPIVLGDLRSERLEEVGQRALRRDDTLVWAFSAWGPKKLGQLLGETFWETQECGPYNGICDLCTRLLDDGRRVEALRALLDDPGMRRRVARSVEIVDALDRSRGGTKREWEVENAAPP
jgi:MoaA/NifB/PqqE/SkfB family radical SAM enzyme